MSTTRGRVVLHLQEVAMITSLELRRKLDEARQAGRFMVCLSWMDGDAKVENYCLTEDYPRAEIMPAMERFVALLEEETPSVETGDT